MHIPRKSTTLLYQHKNYVGRKKFEHTVTILSILIHSCIATMIMLSVCSPVSIIGAEREQ